jgi:hypothetical protein
MVDAILVYSPEKELEVLSSLAEVGDKIDWKPAIILSAAYLETFGIKKLKRYFELKKVQLGELLKRLSLSKVANLLKSNDLINEKQFSKMKQIWSERNDIVHPKGILPAYVGGEANKKYGKMIGEALKIIEYLKK